MISPDSQEDKYPGLARQVTCDGASMKKQCRRVGSRYRLQRRNFETLSGPRNVSGFLCQERQSSASVKNYNKMVCIHWCRENWLSCKATLCNIWKVLETGQVLDDWGNASVALVFKKRGHGFTKGEWCLTNLIAILW